MLLFLSILIVTIGGLIVLGLLAYITKAAIVDIREYGWRNSDAGPIITFLGGVTFFVLFMLSILYVISHS